MAEHGHVEAPKSEGDGGGGGLPAPLEVIAPYNLANGLTDQLLVPALVKLPLEVVQEPARATGVIEGGGGGGEHKA